MRVLQHVHGVPRTRRDPDRARRRHDVGDFVSPLPRLARPSPAGCRWRNRPAATRRGCAARNGVSARQGARAHPHRPLAAGLERVGVADRCGARSGGAGGIGRFSQKAVFLSHFRKARTTISAMSTATANALPPVSLRQDAGVIGLVGLAHMISHFSQLLLAPLFPWLKDAFNASYTELGFLMTVFFVVSCAVQAASGFLVDRYGPRPILFGGPGAAGRGGIRFRVQPQATGSMALFSVVAGVGNGVFHPVDYTLLNRKVSAPRLGHAYSFHGITGSLGWALAPALLVPLAIAFSWRVALMAAGALAFVVLAVLVAQPRATGTAALAREAAAASTRVASRRQFRLPAHPGGVDVFRLLFLLRRRAQRDPGVRAGSCAATARRAGGARGDVPHRLHGVQRRRHGARRLSGGGPGAMRADRRHRLRHRSLDRAGHCAWRPFPRWRCRRCSGPWVSPAASPGHRATCW